MDPMRKTVLLTNSKGLPPRLISKKELKLTFASVILNIINIAVVLILKNKLPPEVPLFYGLAEGEEQLTTNSGLIFPGALSGGIVLINLALAAFSENSFLRQTLIVSGLGVSVLSLITVVKIIFLVGPF